MTQENLRTKIEEALIKAKDNKLTVGQLVKCTGNFLYYNTRRDYKLRQVLYTLKKEGQVKLSTTRLHSGTEVEWGTVKTEQDSDTLQALILDTVRQAGQVAFAELFRELNKDKSYWQRIYSSKRDKDFRVAINQLKSENLITTSSSRLYDHTIVKAINVPTKNGVEHASRKPQDKTSSNPPLSTCIPEGSEYPTWARELAKQLKQEQADANIQTMTGSQNLAAQQIYASLKAQAEEYQSRATEYTKLVSSLNKLADEIQTTIKNSRVTSNDF